MGTSRNNNWLNGLMTAILLLFTLLLFFQSARRAAGRIAADFFYPFLAFPVKVERKVAGQSAMLHNRGDLVAALDASERLNMKLAADLSAFTSFRDENRELRRLMGLRERSGRNGIFAEILLRDPLEWDQRFTIDKGSDDGIRSGNLVVTGGREQNEMSLVAIGRIGTISRHTAEVITLADRNSSLSVKLPANGACGLFDGGFIRGNRRYAKLQYLPRDLDYLPGMAVVTSGLTDSTPPDIRVGALAAEATSIKVRDNLFSVAEVLLDFDLNQVRFVMVLTGDRP